MSAVPQQVDLQRALGHFASGVTVVTTSGPLGPAGITASSFTSLSLDPPLILVCVARSAVSFPAFERCETFGVSILADEQRELAVRYATRGAAKFLSGETENGAHCRAPLIVGALAQLECTVHDLLPGGDHAILVGRVIAARHSTGRPLVNFNRALGSFMAPAPHAA